MPDAQEEAVDSAGEAAGPKEHGEEASAADKSGKWSEEDRLLFGATWRLWPLPVLGAALTVFVVGFAVTPDGSGYMLLGNILLNGGFPDDWDFVREPGLPMLLRLTALSHPGIPGYLIASGFMAGLAVALVGGAFYDLGRQWQRLLAGVIAVSASIYISYAGWVVQQIGLALLLALVGWIIRWIQAADGIKPWRLVCLGLVGSVGLYYSFVFAPTVVIAFVICLAVVLRRIRGLDRRRVLVAALALSSTVLLPALLYAPWNAVKSDHNTRLASGTDLTGSVAGGVASGLTSDPVGYLRNRLATSLALLHLDGAARWVSAGQTIYPSEDLLWAGMRYGYRDQAPQCGVLDLQPEGKAAVNTFLAGRQYCAPFDGSGFLSVNALRSYRLGGVASIIMMLGTLWALFRRRELVPLLLLPWGWIAMYSLFIPIDRYAIPIWPYKVVFAVLVVAVAVGWAVSRIRAAFSTDSNDDPSKAVSGDAGPL